MKEQFLPISIQTSPTSEVMNPTNSSNDFLRIHANSVDQRRTEKCIIFASSQTSKKKDGKRSLDGYKKWLKEGAKRWLFALRVMTTSIEGMENHRREKHHWRAECGESR